MFLFVCALGHTQQYLGLIPGCAKGSFLEVLQGWYGGARNQTWVGPVQSKCHPLYYHYVPRFLFKFQDISDKRTFHNLVYI